MSKYIWLVDNLSFWLMWTPGLWIFCLLRKSENTNIQILSQELFYVNVSDQASIFTHETKMLILVCLKYFLAFNVLHMTRTDGWVQNLSKKRVVIALKDNTSIMHYCDAQCITVLYSDWSLQMGQITPKMTLGTLTMSADDFPGV